MSNEVEIAMKILIRVGVTAIAALIYTFALQMKKFTVVRWWGNFLFLFFVVMIMYVVFLLMGWSD